MELVVVFIVNLMSSVLGTCKTLLIQKNKAVLAMLTIIMSQLLFYALMGMVLSTESWLIRLGAASATGVGAYLTLKVSDKFSKDRTYVTMVSSNNDKEAMEEICAYLKEHKIKNIITDSYTKEWATTYAVLIFAETKEDSKKVDKFIAGAEHKYFRIAI